MKVRPSVKRMYDMVALWLFVSIQNINKDKVNPLKTI